MRKELSAQLEEFLEKGAPTPDIFSSSANTQPPSEAPSFIDTLFIVLRTKSYLPYTSSPPHLQASSSSNPQAGETGIPIPLDSLLSNNATSPERAQKRSHEGGDHDAHRPAKGPRLGADSQFSRYANGRDGRPTGQWGGRFDRNERQGMPNGMGPGMGNMNGQRIQTYQPPDQRKGICRDYHSTLTCSPALPALSNKNTQIMDTAPEAHSANIVTVTTRSFQPSSWQCVVEVLKYPFCPCSPMAQCRLAWLDQVRLTIRTRHVWICDPAGT
jgi:hypothetical protein